MRVEPFQRRQVHRLLLRQLPVVTRLERADLRLLRLQLPLGVRQLPLQKLRRRRRLLRAAPGVLRHRQRRQRVRHLRHRVRIAPPIAQAERDRRILPRRLPDPHVLKLNILAQATHEHLRTRPAVHLRI